MMIRKRGNSHIIIYTYINILSTQIKQNDNLFTNTVLGIHNININYKYSQF